MFSCVNAYFLTFIFRQSYSDKVQKTNNMIVFSPWVFLNVTGLIGYLLNINNTQNPEVAETQMPNRTKFFASILGAAMLVSSFVGAT
jgi:hypothetical protein